MSANGPQSGWSSHERLRARTSTLPLSTMPKAIWKFRHLDALIEPYGFRHGAENNAYSWSDMAPGFLNKLRSDASSLRMFADS